MKIKFKVTLGIKPGFVNSMSLAELMYFITIVHCRCLQGHKFYLSRLMNRSNWYLFFVLYGQGIEFWIKEIAHHEKEN
jgi:hypothetical protein